MGRAHDLRGRDRPAFTLIEAVVGVVLTGLTFGILWGIFFYDNRRIHASMERLTALRGGEGIVEALKTDLANLRPPSSEEYLAWSNRPVLLESSGADPAAGYDSLTLYRFVEQAGSTGRSQKITYRYDPGTRRVLRGIDGKQTPIGGTEIVDFLLDFRREGQSEVLTYEIVTSFEGMTRLTRPGENVKDMVFRGQIDLVDRTGEAHRFRWVPSGASNR